MFASDGIREVVPYLLWVWKYGHKQELCPVTAGYEESEVVVFGATGAPEVSVAVEQPMGLLKAMEIGFRPWMIPTNTT